MLPDKCFNGGKCLKGKCQFCEGDVGGKQRTIYECKIRNYLIENENTVAILRELIEWVDKE